MPNLDGSFVNGAYQVREIAWKPPKAKPGKSSHHQPAGNPAGLALRGWKAPLHWQVPPPFENPRLAIELLGVERFCEEVRDYWAAIGEKRVRRAQELHPRWVVRACLRTFEAQVRGYWKQEVGGKGRIFPHASDELILPETLLERDALGNENGRFMSDLHRHFRAYGVPENQWLAAERLLRAKLKQIWGIST